MSDAFLIPPDQTKVLIVGAGPVGLVSSLVLAEFGVECTVIERNLSTTTHPKMDVTNGRSMEIFRRLGIVDQFIAAGVSGNINIDVSWITSMVGHQIHRFYYPSPNEARRLYKNLNDGTQPLEPAIRISQIVVEPLLRDIALASPLITVCYGWKFNELEQDINGVTATIENSKTGEMRNVYSNYLAGCDGGGSRVRRCLGIELEGKSNIRKRYSVHFRSDDKEIFEPWGPAWHYQSPVHGTLISQNGDDRFTLHSFLKEDQDETTVDPYDIVRPFVGKDFHFELIQANGWDNNLLVAESYRDRRVLLAGDSTHQYIPTGGYGMNTGVGDAFSLGWMLAAVINGWGGAGLLDAYEFERRPIGLKNCAMSGRHADARLAIGEVWTDNLDDDGAIGVNQRAELAKKIVEIGNAENESLGIEMGYSYAGSPIICTDPDAHLDDNPLVYQPTTIPGYRPPAIYLEGGTAMFDLFGPEFTLLNFAPEEIDVSAFESEAETLGLDLKTLPITDQHAKSIYESNLVLIRPDQHVCWRGGRLPEGLGTLLRKVSGN